MLQVFNKARLESTRKVKLCLEQLLNSNLQNYLSAPFINKVSILTRQSSQVGVVLFIQ